MQSCSCRRARLYHGVDREIARDEATYLGRHGRLLRIDAAPVSWKEGDFVGYALKRAGRDAASPDGILILPKRGDEPILKAKPRRR
jgi:hypothetical protein